MPWSSGVWACQARSTDLRENTVSDLVTVALFGSVLDAEVARNLLESNGIRAAVFADDAGGMYPPLGAGVRVVVRQEDATRAREILDSPPALEDEGYGPPEA